mmetsp:Transcript_8679/g.21170  ORF Transcript_8679/g.21170 Transcript_8679/m.21170 type:complete len:204 (+) Transcript_8679:148-759(+)
MAKSSRKMNPRRTGNLFTIDANAVSEAREMSSNESFFFDRFSDISSTSEKSSVLRSSIRSAETTNKKRFRSVSFADSIETVHIVDNLKLCLTNDEKEKLWDMAPESSSDSSGGLSPLEDAMCEIFSLHDGPSSGRRDKKRRRRKTQSKLRNINNNQCVEQSPKGAVNKISARSPMMSPLRSVTSRLGFGRERMQKSILVPLRE